MENLGKEIWTKHVIFLPFGEAVTASARTCAALTTLLDCAYPALPGSCVEVFGVKSWDSKAAWASETMEFLAYRSLWRPCHSSDLKRFSVSILMKKTFIFFWFSVFLRLPWYSHLPLAMQVSVPAATCHPRSREYKEDVRQLSHPIGWSWDQSGTSG